MTRLPDQQPTAPTAGQPTIHDQQRIDRIATAFSAALDEIDKPTAVRIEDPDIPSWEDGPRIGTAPAVQQPGRASMSQEAVDYSARVLSTAVASVLFSAAGSGLLVASNHANPTTLGLVVAAPAVLAIPILALKGLMKSAKEVAQAAPPEIHQHYSGHVHQDNRQNHLHTDTRGVIAVTRNELPPATR